MAINFPDSPSSGDTFTDATSGFTFQYNGTVWRSFDPSTVANIREIDDISSDFDGSDTTFTLKVAAVNVEPANVQQLIISVGGVMQNAGQDYTVSGSTLTFTTAPTSGLTFFGVLLGTALALNTVADDSVGSSSLKSEDFTIGGSGNTVTIPGNLTVQGTETIINTNELNVQDKTIGIGSTNAPTAASQDGAGAIIYGQTHVNILYDADKAALGINTGVSVAGFITATGLRSLGVTTCGAGLSLADSVKAKFGNSGDLEIFHNGTNSIVSDAGTGELSLQSNGTGIRLWNSTNGETMLLASNNSSVELYENNVKRLETATDDQGGGVIVTGKIVGTAATIGSGVTINNTGIDAGNAGIVTAGTVAAPSNMAFQAGGSERVRISSAGSVGIGTDLPGGKVTVAGISASARLELKRTNTNTTGAIGAINWTALDGHSVANMYALGDGDDEGAHLVFKTTSAAASNDPFNAATVERLRIGSAGQLGLSGANYGTSGQVLTSQGASAAPQWADAGGGAWEVVSTTALSGSTSDVQLYGWSNNYAQYKVVFQDCYYASDVKMRIRFYTDTSSGNNGTLVTSQAYAYTGVYNSFGSTSGPTCEGSTQSYFYPYTTAAGGAGEIYTGELIFPMKTSGFNDGPKCYGNMMSHHQNWFGIACELTTNTTHFLTGIHIYFTQSGNNNPLSPTTGRITLLRMKYS